MLASLTALLVSLACEPVVTVVGHGVPDAVVDEMQADAPALFADVRARLELDSCAPVHVDLMAAIEKASDLDPPWSLPEWAAGAAQPEHRRIVVAVTANGARQDRTRVLLHELAHVGTHEAAGGAAVPRWLDEGTARVIAGEHGSDDLEVLARARVADRVLPLSALDRGFPARGDLASIAYAASGRAVSLMVADDPRAPGRVLRELSEGSTLDDALAGVTGRRLWQLELDVERSIPLASAWAVVGLETDLALGAAALVCAWAGLRARRRLRARMAALDDSAVDDRALDDEGKGQRSPARAAGFAALPVRDVVLHRFTTSPAVGGD